MEQMYVRYLGTRNTVCFTVLSNGHFYMAERDECTPAELAVADAGGGDMPLSRAVAMVADMAEWCPPRGGQ